MGNSVYTQFESDGVICCSNVFIIFALRNIDHNPSSPSTEDSWDGTANSLTKHLESKTHGIKRCSAQSAHAALIVLQHLPKEYTTVYPFVFRSTDVYVPRLHKRKDMVPSDILMI